MCTAGVGRGEQQVGAGGVGQLAASSLPWESREQPGAFLAWALISPTPASPHNWFLSPAGPQESAWVIRMQTVLCKSSERYSNHFCEGLFPGSPASGIHIRLSCALRTNPAPACPCPQPASPS